MAKKDKITNFKIGRRLCNFRVYGKWARLRSLRSFASLTRKAYAARVIKEKKSVCEYMHGKDNP